MYSCCSRFLLRPNHDKQKTNAMVRFIGSVRESRRESNDSAVISPGCFREREPENRGENIIQPGVRAEKFSPVMKKDKATAGRCVVVFRRGTVFSLRLGNACCNLSLNPIRFPLVEHARHGRLKKYTCNNYFISM